MELNNPISEVLIDYIYEESQLPIIYLSDKYVILKHNNAFRKMAGDKSLVNLPLEGIMHIESISEDISVMENYTSRKIHCTIDSKTGIVTSLFGVLLTINNNLLLIFEKYILSEYEIVSQLSQLNVEMSNLSRSLAKKNYELEQANEKIVESRKRFDEIIYEAEQISKIGIFEIDWKKDNQYWSNGIFEILGVDEIKTLSYEELLKFIHKDDVEYVSKSVEDVMNSAILKTLQFRIINKQKEIVYIDCIIKSIFDQSGVIQKTTAVCRNITKIKQLQESNKEMEAKLSEKSRTESLGTLARGFAHEINNPLNGIINYAQLILDKTEDDETMEYAGEIVNESDRVADIVKSILYFSEQNNQPMEKVDIQNLIKVVFSGLSLTLQENNIKISIEIEKDILFLTCRVSQIQQVIINIIQNSINSLNIKYPEKDKNKCIRLKMNKIEKQSKNYIRVEIMDNGTGISELISGRIFDPFFSTLTKDKAKGLGLTYSKKIAQEHQGDLTFETKEGSYTKFYLDLPIDNM